MKTITKAFTVVVEYTVDEEDFYRSIAECLEEEGIEVGPDKYNAEDYLNERTSEMKFEDLEDHITELLEGVADDEGLVVSQVEVKTIL